MFCIDFIDFKKAGKDLASFCRIKNVDAIIFMKRKKGVGRVEPNHEWVAT
jgi:hypothetical protein